MAYELLYEWLFYNTDLSFLRLFKYITFRSAYAIITSIILSLIIAPWLIRYLQKKKMGQQIRKDGPKTHLNKSGTPTMGGILIIGVISFSVLFWGRIDNIYILLLLFTIVGFGIIGFIDDYKKLILKNTKGLSIKEKLIWQTILASIISIALYIYNHGNLPIYIPFIDKPVVNDVTNWTIPLYFFDLPLYIFWGIIVIVMSSNAVNLTDGLDGLAIGLLIFVGIAFAILSYLSGHTKVAEYLNIAFVKEASELTVFCAALVGASIGFLWFNSHPAQVFMGDTGSLSLGGVIGVLALMLKKEFLLIIIGGVFVIEAISVLIQIFYYKKTKKRYFKMAPIHHHFELSGLHESKVIIRLWIIGAILGLLALSTLKIQ